jgi:hypothetical protein
MLGTAEGDGMVASAALAGGLAGLIRAVTELAKSSGTPRRQPQAGRRPSTCTPRVSQRESQPSRRHITRIRRGQETCEVLVVTFSLVIRVWTE